MQRSREEKVFGEIRLARPAQPEAQVRRSTQIHCPLCTSSITVPNDQEPAKFTCALCGMAVPFTPPRSTEAEPPHGSLENWLAGRPLQPRRLNGRERLRQWCAERPYLVGVTAVTLLLLTLVSGLSISAYRSAWLQWREANQQLEEWQRQAEESPAIAAEEKPTGTTPVAAEGKPIGTTPVAATPASESKPVPELSPPALESAQREATLR